MLDIREWKQNEINNMLISHIKRIGEDITTSIKKEKDDDIREIQILLGLGQAMELINIAIACCDSCTYEYIKEIYQDIYKKGTEALYNK